MKPKPEFFTDFFLLSAKSILGKKPKLPGVVCVEHMFSNSERFITLLDDISEKLIIIPKRSSLRLHPDIAESMTSAGLDIRNLGRKYFECPDRTENFLRKEFGESPFIILDHGGYFAPTYDAISKKFPNLLGIVEHTENGHLRYEQVLKSLSEMATPVLSVARDPMKTAENMDVGKAIVNCTKAVMMASSKVNFSDLKRVGVIGFGRLGYVIADEIRKDGIEPKIVEISNQRRAEALAKQYQLTTIDVIASSASLIFSATGSRALKTEHFDVMKNGTIITTVTGADDEFDLPKLVDDGVLRLSGLPNTNIAHYKNRKGHTIDLILGGGRCKLLFPTWRHKRVDNRLTSNCRIMCRQYFG